MCQTVELSFARAPPMTAVTNSPRATGVGLKATAAPLKPIKLADVAADKKVVVKADETLWDIGFKLLGPNGNNTAKVARLVEGLKKENPAINCAQRDFGNLLALGDELKIPNMIWLAAPPKARPANHAEQAAQARAQQSLNDAARAQESAKELSALKANLLGAASFLRDKGSLNEGQKRLVAGLVARGEALESKDLPISSEELRALKLASADTDGFSNYSA